MKGKLQTYVIVVVDGRLKLSCLKCGRLLDEIKICNHIIKGGDELFKIDRRRIDLI